MAHRCPNYCHRCPDIEGGFMPGCYGGAIWWDIAFCNCEKPEPEKCPACKGRGTVGKERYDRIWNAVKEIKAR